MVIRAIMRKLRGRARRSERGMALLATLLAVALMTILVVDFATSAALGYRSAANQANELRALYLARSGIQVGVALLERDSFSDALQQQAFDSLKDVWAIPTPAIPVDGGTVSVSIVDEARKLNVNRLYNWRAHQIDDNYAQMIARLFESIGVTTDLIPIIVDWLDPDSIDSEGGAESDYYLQLMPPYEPRNASMPTIGDLRALKGMDDATFFKLGSYLTTSNETVLNLNTASPEVLSSLSPILSNNPDLVKEIVAAREFHPFMSPNDAMNLPGIGEAIPSNSSNFQLAVHSTFFTIIGQGQFAGARRRIYALVRRNANGSAMLISWHED
jgi:general secretion pathway protein K